MLVPKRLRFRQLFAAAVALVAVGTTVSACDSSPYAATVNATVIRQTALNAELRAWGGNRAYVAAYKSANAVSNGGTGLTVGGDAPGTYSMSWVADTLSGLVRATALHNHLRAVHVQPGPALFSAARSVSEIDHPNFWDSFSLPFRAILTRRLAEEAVITPPTSVDQSTLQAGYNEYEKYFFSRVCTIEASVFSEAAAQSLSKQGVTNGASVCYSQAQFEGQTPAFQNAVMALAVGATSAPITTNYGYQVVKVVSRQVQGLNPSVQRALAVIYLIVNGRPNPPVDQVVTAARVRINPAYGTWKSGQVVPPPAPPAST